MTTKSLLSILVALSVSYSVVAQGCSDAGFCTVGGLGHQKDSVTRNVLSLIMATGKGEQGVFVFTPGMQYERRLSSVFTIQGKVTANYASGDLGSATGAGDFYLSGIASPFKNRSRGFFGIVYGWNKITSGRWRYAQGWPGFANALSK